jgi:dolichol-phosphate mannosyltransferase
MSAGVDGGETPVYEETVDTDLRHYRGLISVVIPAYNEAPLVERCLRETVAVMNAFDCRYEVILVDDGSEDSTLELARAAANRLPHVRVIGHDVNLGKGSAIQRGALAAHGDLVLTLDADLEVHPRQVALLYEALVRTGADVVIGSKLHPDSRTDVPPGRRTLTVGYYVLVRILFALPVHDTQTGLKLFKRAPLMRVMPRLLVKHFAYDLELLVNLHRDGYKIVEAPVVVTRTRAFPRIGLRDSRLIAQDTAAIWYRTYLRRWYDKRAAELELDGVTGEPGLDDREREAESA